MDTFRARSRLRASALLGRASSRRRRRRRRRRLTSRLLTSITVGEIALLPVPNCLGSGGCSCSSCVVWWPRLSGVREWLAKSAPSSEVDVSRRRPRRRRLISEASESRSTILLPASGRQAVSQVGTRLCSHSLAERGETVSRREKPDKRERKQVVLVVAAFSPPSWSWRRHRRLCRLGRAEPSQVL